MQSAENWPHFEDAAVSKFEIFRKCSGLVFGVMVYLKILAYYVNKFYMKIYYEYIYSVFKKKNLLTLNIHNKNLT